MFVRTHAHTKIHYYETFYAMMKRVIASGDVDEEEDEDEREEGAQRYDKKCPLSWPAPHNLPAHAYTDTHRTRICLHTYASMCT